MTSISAFPGRARGLVATLALTSMLSGCASLFSSNSYDVLVESRPADVPFIVSDNRGRDVATGVTPATVHLDAYAPGYAVPARYRVRFERDDLQPLELPLRASLSPTFLLNLLGGLGVPAMLFIDPLTGALFNLPPRLQGELTVLPDATALPPVPGAPTDAPDTDSIR